MVNMEKNDIKSLLPEELQTLIKEKGLPGYRAGQVFEWLTKGADSFEEMTNLPAALKDRFEREFCIFGVTIERKWRSALDNTVKYLYRLHDGEYVEAVLMQYHHGYTLCISTQAGCKMGCTFCATGLGGFRRNLTASEMLSQIQAAQKDQGVRVSNIVLIFASGVLRKGAQHRHAAYFPFHLRAGSPHPSAAKGTSAADPVGLPSCAE